MFFADRAAGRMCCAMLARGNGATPTHPIRREWLDAGHEPTFVDAAHHAGKRTLE
jgi:hypothetical protein